MRTLARSLAVFAVGLVAPLASAHTVVTQQNDFKLGAHPGIIVDSAGGSVELTAGPAGAVRVVADRQAESEDAARKLDVQIKQEGDTIRVHFAHQNSGLKSANVTFKISAPANSKLDVSTGGGSVSAHGFGGGIKIETGGGSIDVDGGSGALTLRSGGGGIEAHHLNGTVDASTGGGSVEIDGALNGKNRVQTGGGSIHVALPTSSRLSVDAATGGGSADNEFGLPSDGERHSGRFHGNIGDGSAGTLELRTGGGSIELVKR